MIINRNADGTFCRNADGTFPYSDYCFCYACATMNGPARCLQATIAGATIVAPDGNSVVEDVLNSSDWHLRAFFDVIFTNGSVVSIPVGPISDTTEFEVLRCRSSDLRHGPDLFEDRVGILGTGQVREVIIQYFTDGTTYKRQVGVRCGGGAAFLNIATQDHPFDCESAFTVSNDYEVGDIGDLDEGDGHGDFPLKLWFPTPIVAYGGTITITPETCCTCGCGWYRDGIHGIKFPCLRSKISIQLTDSNVQAGPFTLEFSTPIGDHCSTDSAFAFYSSGASSSAEAEMWRYVSKDVDGNCKWYMEVVYTSYNFTSTTVKNTCYLLFVADLQPCAPTDGWSTLYASCVTVNAITGEEIAAPVRACPASGATCHRSYLAEIQLKTAHLTSGTVFSFCLLDADWPSTPGSSSWNAQPDPTQGIILATMFLTVNDDGDCVRRLVLFVDGTVHFSGHSYAGVWYFEQIADTTTHACPASTGWTCIAGGDDADLAGHPPVFTSFVGGERCGCFPYDGSQGEVCSPVVATLSGDFGGSCNLVPSDDGSGNATWTGSYTRTLGGDALGINFTVFCTTDVNGVPIYETEIVGSGAIVGHLYTFDSNPSITCPTGLTWTLTDNASGHPDPTLTIELP